MTMRRFLSKPTGWVMPLRIVPFLAKWRHLPEAAPAPVAALAPAVVEDPATRARVSLAARLGLDEVSLELFRSEASDALARCSQGAWRVARLRTTIAERAELLDNFHLLLQLMDVELELEMNKRELRQLNVYAQSLQLPECVQMAADAGVRRS
jgi:hypothetical protein